MKCTFEFAQWLDSLNKSIAIRVEARIQRLIDGNPGLHRRFDNILEIKWKSGAMGSFRMYCCDLDGTTFLFGGQKGRQSKDIEMAKQLLEGIKNGTVRTKIYE